MANATLAALRRRREKVTADEALTAEIEIVEEGAEEAAEGSWVGRRLSALAASTVPVWIGVVLIAAGFALIGYTWARVAGLLNVGLQLPYFASGGLTSIALILIGLTIVNIAAKHRDAAEQSRQLAELKELLSELRRVVEGGK